MISLNHVEKNFTRWLSRLVNAYAGMRIFPPYIIKLSLVGVAGCGAIGDSFESETPFQWHTLKESILSIPELQFEKNDNIDEIYKTLFDMLWNAFGYFGSPNFRDGKWVRPR